LKKDVSLTKTKRITVRMSEELHEALSNDAFAAGLSLAEYTRQILSGYQPEVRYETIFDSRELLKKLGDLGHLGNNLNQIAKHLNQGTPLTNEICMEVKRCVSQLYDIRDDVHKMAGEYRGNT
jgi:hypothetical protein